jgi:hypothetical protein
MMPMTERSAASSRCIGWLIEGLVIAAGFITAAFVLAQDYQTRSAPPVAPMAVTAD